MSNTEAESEVHNALKKYYAANQNWLRCRHVNTLEVYKRYDVYTQPLMNFLINILDNIDLQPRRLMISNTLGINYVGLVYQINGTSDRVIKITQSGVYFTYIMEDGKIKSETKNEHSGDSSTVIDWINSLTKELMDKKVLLLPQP